jgi:predicted GIY-YIG superfamily endonuclease
MTSDLVQRIWEHKSKAVPGFTARHGVDQLGLDPGVRRDDEDG